MCRLGLESAVNISKEFDDFKTMFFDYKANDKPIEYSIKRKQMRKMTKVPTKVIPLNSTRFLAIYKEKVEIHDNSSGKNCFIRKSRSQIPLDTISWSPFYECFLVYSKENGGVVAMDKNLELLAEIFNPEEFYSLKYKKPFPLEKSLIATTGNIIVLLLTELTIVTLRADKSLKTILVIPFNHAIVNSFIFLDERKVLLNSMQIIQLNHSCTSYETYYLFTDPEVINQKDIVLEEKQKAFTFGLFKRFTDRKLKKFESFAFRYKFKDDSERLVGYIIDLVSLGSTLSDANTINLCSEVPCFI